jgi:hypothetical protein
VRLERLVPASAAGYEASAPGTIYDRATLFGYMDGAGEVYLQYDFRALFVREFSKRDQPGITAQVFDMGRPEDAFGIFSLDREDDDAGLGQDSEYGGGLLRFWKGRFFVSVFAEIESSEAREAVFAIGRAAAAAIRESGPRPAVVEALPTEGLVVRRVRYFHGAFGLASRYPAADGKRLGLSQDTDAVLATYRSGDAASRLLIVLYPDAQKAREALDAFSHAPETALGQDGTARVADGKWVGARQVGKAFVAVFEAATRKDIEDLLTRTAGRLEGASWTR